MNAGWGLSVRWSLQDAAPDVPQRLRDYVVGTSIARFMFLEGLAFKVWRMREGEWFEGTYVFDTAVARDDFRTSFLETVKQAPGTAIIGSVPLSVEAYEVVAIAEGPEGFRRGPGPAST